MTRKNINLCEIDFKFKKNVKNINYTNQLF